MEQPTFLRNVLHRAFNRKALAVVVACWIAYLLAGVCAAVTYMIVPSWTVALCVATMLGVVLLTVAVIVAHFAETERQQDPDRFVSVSKEQAPLVLRPLVLAGSVGMVTFMMKIFRRMIERVGTK